MSIYEGTGPYRIPDPPATEPMEAGVSERKRAASLLLGGIGGFVASIAALFVVGPLAFFPFVAVMGVGLVGAVCGVMGVVRATQGAGASRKAVRRVSGLLALGNLVMMALGAAAAVASLMTFRRGRQLRRFGRVLLPPSETGGAWAARSIGVDVPEEVRAALAAQWRENGKTEHASVAAFARLTLDLMALGAPPALIVGAQEDALEEIRHTELCFSLARAIDGHAESPGPFPEAQRVATLPRARTLALARLAVDSLLDGALHEGVSARVLAKLAKRCEAPAVGAMLKAIAADEGRHAAHGWDVVEWCLVEGGAPVESALLGALQVLPATMKSPLPGVARGGGWERYGIHGEALETDEFSKARAELVARVARRVEQLKKAS
jgi:hypothetical protein